MRHQAYDGLPTRPRLCAWHRANTSNDTRTQTNDTGCQNICEQHTSQTCESTCTTTLLYRHKLLLCTIAAGAAQTFRLSLTRTVRDRKLGRQTARSKNALFCTFTIEYISRYSQAALMKRQITFHTSRNRKLSAQTLSAKVVYELPLSLAPVGAPPTAIRDRQRG